MAKKGGHWGDKGTKGDYISIYPIVEAVEPFKLHPTSMLYIYKVFEHLKQLWMGIWQHTHTITTTEVSPDLGKS